MSRFRVGDIVPKTATAAATVPEQLQAAANARLAKSWGVSEAQKMAASQSQPAAPSNEGRKLWDTGSRFFRGGRKLGNKFNRCVKSVRKTVRARKGSNKESAAIAICTKSVLHTRGKTMKRYRKGRLVTQKKFRGGCWGSCA